MMGHNADEGPKRRLVNRDVMGPALAVGMVVVTALIGGGLLRWLPAEMIVGLHIDLGGELVTRRAPAVVLVVVLSGMSAVVATGYVVARWVDARADGGRYRRDIDRIGLAVVALACIVQLLLLASQL